MSTTLTHRPPDRQQADGRRENPSAAEALTPRAEAVDRPPPQFDDGAISDAKRHARRRRIRTGLAAAVVVGALGASALMAFASNGAGPSDVQEGMTAPAPNAAAMGEPDRIVASWSRTYAGWVFVYGDGRVLSYIDNSGGIVEMQLSAEGAEMVASGDVPIDAFVRHPWTIPEVAWGRADARTYHAERMAVCHSPGRSATPDAPLGSITPFTPRLPAEIRAAVQNTATNFSIGSRFPGFRPDADGATRCWVLGIDQANELRQRTLPLEGSATPQDELAPDQSAHGWSGLLKTADGSSIELVALPLLPHGGFVLWGG